MLHIGVCFPNLIKNEKKFGKKPLNRFFLCPLLWKKRYRFAKEALARQREVILADRET